MNGIQRGQGIAHANRLSRFPNQDAVHNQRTSDHKILGGGFVFGVNVYNQDASFSQATARLRSCGIPAIEKSLGLKLSGFVSRQKFGVGIALARACSGAAGVVFGIVSSFNRMRFARVPLAPACRYDVGAHLRIEKNNFGIWTPGPSEPDICSAGGSGQRAVVEDKTAVLSRIMLRLSSNKTFEVRSAVNLAVIKNRFAVSEDEINVALDVAMRKVLSRRNARFAVGRAVAAAGVERVLVAEKTHIAEHGFIDSDQYGQRL